MFFVMNSTLTISFKQIRSGSLGQLFRPDTFVTGETGAGNNWAKGCKLWLYHAPPFVELISSFVVYTEGMILHLKINH